MPDLSVLIPVLVVVGSVVALLILVALLARNYIKVPPNKACVFYGRRGHTVVTGGARFKWPIIEEVDWMDLNAFQLQLKLAGIPNKDGVKVNVDAVATCKVDSTQEALRCAVERFLGKPDQELQGIIRENLEGQLRSVIGQMTVEDLIRDREQLNNKVKGEAQEELNKVGVKIEILNIQSITDDFGYITALGQRRTAEVKRDADIGTSEARRDARVKSSEADRVGATAAANNEALIAQAEKDRDIKRAQYLAEVEAEQAKARQSGPQADATARQQVTIQEVKVEEERARALIAVREQEIVVAERQQEATVVVPARKAADAKAAAAEGDKRKQIVEAEGMKEAVLRRAEAEAQRLRMEGEGESSKIRALGLAEAERQTALGRAEGEAIKAKLVGEAEGLERKADAYAKLNQAAAFQLLLEKAPDIIQSLAPVMEAVAKPLSGIDKVVVIENGGGSDGSMTGVQKFASNGPGLVMSFLQNAVQSADAMGFSIDPLLNKVGIQPAGQKKKDEGIAPPQTQDSGAHGAAPAP